MSKIERKAFPVKLVEDEVATDSYLEFRQMEVEPVIVEELVKEKEPIATKYRVNFQINISSAPGRGKLLGFQGPGEVVAIEDIEGWVKTEKGWLDKRFLELIE